MSDDNSILDKLEFSMLDIAELRVDDDQPAWALLAIPNNKYEEYKLAIDSGQSINLYDYGDVLAYKVGSEKPSLEEEKELTEKFGYIPNLNIEEKIKNIVEDQKNS